MALSQPSTGAHRRPAAIVCGNTSCAVGRKGWCAKAWTPPEGQGQLDPTGAIGDQDDSEGRSQKKVRRVRGRRGGGDGLAMGDSLSSGYGATPVTNGYAYLLYQQGVYDQMTNTSFADAAIPGATSGQGPRALALDLGQRRPARRHRSQGRTLRERALRRACECLRSHGHQIRRRRQSQQVRQQSRTGPNYRETTGDRANAERRARKRRRPGSRRGGGRRRGARDLGREGRDDRRRRRSSEMIRPGRTDEQGAG